MGRSLAAAGAVGAVLGLIVGYAISAHSFTGFFNWLYWSFQYDYGTFGGFGWGIVGALVGVAVAYVAKR